MAILDLEKLLKSLNREKVQFVLVGGMAAMGHGMNYVTDDLDICYQRTKENYQAIVRALKPANPKLRTTGEALPFLFDEKTIENGMNFTLESDWGSVDLLGELQGLGEYEAVKPGSTQFEFYGLLIDTLSLNDLIKVKKSAGRTKDKLHLLELEAIREISKANKKD